MDCGLSGTGLPAADGQIAIARIDLDSACCASSSLSSKKDRSATAEGVKNEIAPARTIANRIGDQADRLWRRMISLCAGGRDGARSALPDVRTRAAVLSKLEVVDMLSATALPEKHQLMARAVKTAQSAIRFDPNANVLELHEVVLTGNEHLWKVPPINERSADCTRGGVLPNMSKGLAEEAGEFRLAHFAGSKLEFSIVEAAVPNSVLVDPDIIRRVRNGISGLFAGHQPLIGDLVSGIAAKKQVRSGPPTVAGLGHNVSRIIVGANIVGVLFAGMLGIEQRVDFASAEAG